MSKTAHRLLRYGIGALGATAAVCVATRLAGLVLNPWFVALVALGLAAVAWLLNREGDGAPTVAWPRERTAEIGNDDVREVGLTRALSMFASAEKGSTLSAHDVAVALTDVTARKLILRGADPEEPFAGAQSRLSPSLLELCRATRADSPAPRLSRSRLDAYLKEILAL